MADSIHGNGCNTGSRHDGGNGKGAVVLVVAKDVAEDGDRSSLGGPRPGRKKNIEVNVLRALYGWYPGACGNSGNKSARRFKVKRAEFTKSDCAHGRKYLQRRCWHRDRLEGGRSCYLLLEEDSPERADREDRALALKAEVEVGNGSGCDLDLIANFFQGCGYAFRGEQAGNRNIFAPELPRNAGCNLS